MTLFMVRGRWSINLLVVFIFAAAVYLLYSQSTPGGFSEWSSWSPCSKSCGQGNHGRFRKCTSPKPGPLGKDCVGSTVMSEVCSIKKCPIDGGFTSWGEFGTCDKTCGGGIRQRSRSCTNPEPAYGGKSCQETYVDKIACNVKPCPVNGGYSTWGEYSKCEVSGEQSCGKGKRIRTRTCNNPVPQNGGKQCEGADSETAECEIPCPTTTILSRNSSTSTINSTLTTTKSLSTVKPK